MKKILIALKDLKIGGIEKAAITLINYLVDHNYKVILALEERKGELLKNVNKNVKIIEYKPDTRKKAFMRKLINFFKRIKFIIKYKNKFDISISYATYSKTCSYMARTASKHSILWCHADYLDLYNKDINKMKDFFEEIFYYDFSKIVFVSKKGKETFKQVFPGIKNVYYCNNLIDSREIYKLTEEKINLKYSMIKPTFLNVGRHDEKQKKLTRIIEAAKMLKQENYKFRIIFVGEGKDTKKYIELTKKYNLQKNIIFTGAKENPYPYFKIANCVLLSSDYEGYPVVFLESYVLNKPIITTDVSDYKDIQNGRGIVVKKNSKEIYKAMKRYIDDGFYIIEKFDVVKYNTEMEQKLIKILEKF